jgi:hypothetical protein
VWNKAFLKKEGTLGTLRFKVKGLKFKGYVYISLNGLDLYNIEFVKINRKKNAALSEAWGSTKYDEIPETVHELKDIYCDQLTELIDEYVEKTASHKY